jgi:hypothetical protein
MRIEHRIRHLEERKKARNTQVVWVNPDETLEQACKRQGIEYENPMIVNTGIGKIFFVGWQT